MVVASLRRLDKMDRAEGEYLILYSEFGLLDSCNNPAAEPFISDLAQRTRFSGLNKKNGLWKTNAILIEA